MTYQELTLNQRINFKSGYDIAVKYESKRCRLAKAISWTNIPIACCSQVYDIDRFQVSLRTKISI